MSLKRKDVDKLHADGLIDEALREKIIAHYHLGSHSSGRWLIMSLALLAAALIVGGAGMLVAAHWEDLTDLGKASSGAVLLAAAWASYLGVRERLPLLGEGLATIAGVLWGLNIILHVHIFDPDLPPADFIFYFFAGIAPLPFITRQRGLVWLVVGSSVALLGAMVSKSGSEGSWLYLPWLSTEGGNTLAAFGLLGIVWWLLGERARKSTGILRGYYAPGVVVFLVCLLFVQIPLLYGGQASASPLQFNLTWQGYALLVATPVLCLLLKPRGAGWLGWLLMTGATSALLPLVIHLSWVKGNWNAGTLAIPTATVYGVGICIAYAIILLSTGTLVRRKAWINYGSLMVIFIIIGVLTNIFKSMENSGLALIISGSLLVIVLLLLEGQRRRLVKKIKAQPTTSSEA